MRKTAVIVAPGRGTYNRSELGYFARHHNDRADLLDTFDKLRRGAGQESLSDLDSAARFSGTKHTRGDNASALIYACALADFEAIDRDKIDILGITGNSMGWYIALACSGALSTENGFQVVNTMGTLMQKHLIGGQTVYPLVDADWREVPGRRQEISDLMAGLNDQGHQLSISIDLGGMLVLAGDPEGLDLLERRLPRIDDRFPMRLPNHAGFHTALQEPVAALGRAALPADMFRTEHVPLIDGRGAIWHNKAHNAEDLWRYTLDHQVVRDYDFSGAIRTAAREWMPDMFIVTGPGTTLGGAVAQSLVKTNWRGMDSKAAFKDHQSKEPVLVSMGDADQRRLVT